MLNIGKDKEISEKMDQYDLNLEMNYKDFISKILEYDCSSDTILEIDYDKADSQKAILYKDNFCEALDNHEYKDLILEYLIYLNSFLYDVTPPDCVNCGGKVNEYIYKCSNCLFEPLEKKRISRLIIKTTDVFIKKKQPESQDDYQTMYLEIVSFLNKHKIFQ